MLKTLFRSFVPLAVASHICAVAAGAFAQGADSGAASPAQEAPVLSLQECVAIALGNSPTLASVGAQREGAAQGVKGAWGAFLPDVSLSRTYSKNERTDFDVAQTAADLYSVQSLEGPILVFPVSSATGEVADESITTTYQDWSGQASLNVFDGFRNYGGLKSARATLRAAEAAESYSRHQLVESVAAAYFDLLRMERLLEVAAESRDLAARELERMDVYFKLGSAARSDVLQARVRHEQTKLDAVRAQNAVEQAFAVLAHTMNQPLAKRFEIERSVQNADFSLEQLETLYQEAVANRLDLRGREQEVEASKGDVTSASSNLWPSLDLFLSYSRYKNESPYRFGAQESDNLGYGYRLNWNVFDRLQSLTGRSRAKAGVRVAQYALDQARLDAQLEIRSIYNSLLEARERASLSKETIGQTEEELRLAQERFRVGAGTTLDIITAQVNLARARSDEVQAICDWLINAARLDRAVGRTVRFVGTGS